MAKKVFLGVGHGGNDPGAVGYIKEADANLVMAKACSDVLKAHGVSVKMSRTKDENDDLNQEIRECNAFAPDLAADIHNNAGRGDGFECYYSVVGGTGKTLAKNIEAEVKKIGQNSRGCKTKAGNGGADYFGFIRETACPAVICEGVFVDNKADAAQADTAAEQKKFGVAYAKGILKTLGIAYNANAGTTTKKPTATTKKEETKKFEPYYIKTTVDALNVRSGAGTNCTITHVIRERTDKDKKVYTIVEESKGWGKLKSGKGWIFLKYTKKVKQETKNGKPVWVDA